LIIPHPVLLRMRNVSDKICRENQNTHFIFGNFFFSRKLYLYEIMCKNILEPCRLQITMWRMRIACWIPKATDTHSKYVILFFPPQQWLHESTSLLTLPVLSEVTYGSTCQFSYSLSQNLFSSDRFLLEMICATNLMQQL